MADVEIKHKRRAGTSLRFSNSGILIIVIQGHAFAEQWELHTVRKSFGKRIPSTPTLLHRMEELSTSPNKVTNLLRPRIVLNNKQNLQSSFSYFFRFGGSYNSVGKHVVGINRFLGGFR